MNTRKPPCRWRCKVNGCHRYGFTGPTGWLAHVRLFHAVKRPT